MLTIVRAIQGPAGDVANLNAMSGDNESGDRKDLVVSFETIVDLLPEGILITNSDEVIQYANPWMHNVFGTRWSELAGRSLSDLSLGRSLGRTGESNGTLGRLPDELEVEVPQADGSSRWYYIRTLPLAPHEDVATFWLSTVHDITNRRQTEQRIREAALHDPLTNVGNRTLLFERLTHAIARAKRHSRQKFAVLFLDIDQFKIVNDTLGHAAGDLFLIEVSRRLQSFLRPEDTIARIGGDEFVILLESINDVSDASGVAARIEEDLAKPMLIGKVPISASISIGIVQGSSDVESADQLLRRADSAMYRVKRSGGGAYQVFDL